MNSKITKLKCVLLDANIIIKAYELGIWRKLIQSLDIIVSSIIARDEVLFYSTKEGGIPSEINLSSLIAEGKIREVEGDSTDMALLNDLFDQVFLGGFHEGEEESLSLLYCEKLDEDVLFCTADAIAIHALAMIGLSERGISLEKLLNSIGLNKPLPTQYSEKFFKENIKRGQIKRITGDGLAST